MSTSQSDPPVEDQVETQEGLGPGSVAEYAAHVAEVLAGATSSGFGMVKAHVGADRWVEAVTAARDDLGLGFFSWLSAIDWTNEVEVGEPPSEPVEERYEVMCAVSDLTEGRLVVVSTDIGKDSPSLPSLVDVYPGANWHEREAAEMFGIEFQGHPNLSELYLPPGFEGHPLRKSFPLLTREVKPWPGTVDVEGMPSEENVEAGDRQETE